MIMLDIQDLSLRRGNKILFESLSAQMQVGQVVVVLGPNGAGKSTLLLALQGMFPCANGEIQYQQKPVSTYSRQTLSRIFTWQGDLPPSEFGLTVGQRLALSADAKTRQSIEDALQYMDLGLLEQRALGELSSGERQRVEIAATMVRDNPIWLMDEPTAHLDMRHQVDCLRLIKQQSKDGRLIIAVLHDLQQAAGVADVVLLLDGLGGATVGDAASMLTAARLEPVFQVKLTGQGKDLRPVYGEN
ncbi:MAG TPA: ABC transporter ATP-binding protein [Ghiorsea sp.]|nr:ABC transporter ATP-binding protein [Ghiorsea sp.]HIP07230.1 ABC transporter ATP-binding protein [Mariprofundaceae bacterium]